MNCPKITEKSRFQNWLKRKMKFSRLIPIPTKTVGSSNRNRKNQKSRKRRKNLKSRKKRKNLKKINIKKTWFYMFIISKKYLRSKRATCWVPSKHWNLRVKEYLKVSFEIFPEKRHITWVLYVLLFTKEFQMEPLAHNAILYDTRPTTKWY